MKTKLLPVLAALLFAAPDEMGIEGKIMYVYEHGESTGNGGESDFVRRVRTMAWDGKNFKKPVIED